MTITLITGGGRSGKSRKALELAEPYQRKCFLATSEPLDGEMKERIEAHRAERGEGFATLEEPLHLAEALHEAAREHDLILIDCLTLWLGNLMHHLGEEEAEEEIQAFLGELERSTARILIVTNEVGLGIIPENALARKFRDLAGLLNQRTAALADEAILMVSGLPLKLK